MYKVKAKNNITLIIGDLGMTLSDSRFIEINDKLFESSNDINKIKKYLIIEHIDDELKIEKINEDQKIEEENSSLISKIYTKDIDNIEDNIVIESEQQYDKFIANYEEKISSDKNINVQEDIEESNSEVVTIDPTLESSDTEIEDVINNKIDIIKNLDNNVLKDNIEEIKTEEIKNESEVLKSETKEIKNETEIVEKPKRTYKRKTKNMENNL